MDFILREIKRAKQLYIVIGAELTANWRDPRHRHIVLPSVLKLGAREDE